MVRLTKIKKIKVSKEKQWVYDICCKNTKKFLIRGKGNGYILVHNTSMYPSIIRSLRISPETYLCKVNSDYNDIIENVRPYLIHGKNRKWGDRYYEVKFFDGTIRKLQLKDLKKWLNSLKTILTMAPNGAIFKYTDDAIIPQIQENLANMRNIYKTNKKISALIKTKLKEYKKEKFGED